MSLVISNLGKRFGDKPLFEGLSFTADGPVVVQARSGWGKTTLLRIVMGLESADSGIVAGAGRIGAVFQEDRLCPQLSAVQNVELAAPGVSREEILRGFARLGMGREALSLPAARLSGGQKRRAALLRALYAPADTLLFDEPFTGLDPAAVEQAAALLAERCAGKPALIATHDRVAVELLGWPVLELETHVK